MSDALVQSCADASPSTIVNTPPQLTNRQLDVLRLLAEGLTTGEIARELGLSVATVRNYIADVLTVLGVRSRLQAVIAAHKSGLIEL